MCVSGDRLEVHPGNISAQSYQDWLWIQCDSDQDKAVPKVNEGIN